MPRLFLSQLSMAALLAAAITLTPLSSSSARAAEAYAFTVNTPSSLLTYTFNTSAPFTGTMTGDPLAVPPTRLKRGATSFCIFVQNCSTIATTANDTSALAGTVAASGATSTTTPVRPGGTFTVSINPTLGTSEARNVNVNFVSTGSISATANLNNLTYQSFCAGAGTSTTPVCSLPFCTALSIPLGTAVVTAINAVQTASSTGTLTPVAGDPASFDYSIPLTLTVTTTGTLTGNPLAFDPQTVPGTLTGRITRTAGNAATSTSTLSANITSPPSTTPTVVPPAPFLIPDGTPACANLAVQVGITLTSTTITSTNSANVVAAGPRLRCPCDADNSGTVNIDDIFIFINIWFAQAPGSDFDGNGNTNIDDIFQFINCFFAPPFPC